MLNSANQQNPKMNKGERKTNSTEINLENASKKHKKQNIFSIITLHVNHLNPTNLTFID
jgi:hypothetical protein